MTQKIIWFLLFVIVFLLFLLLPLYHGNKKQFYIVTTDKAIYVCTYSDWASTYHLKNVYFIQQDADKKFHLVKHDSEDLGQVSYWPWETILPEKEIKVIEPINQNSPLGKVLQGMEK